MKYIEQGGIEAIRENFEQWFVLSIKEDQILYYIWIVFAYTILK
jgi:hypothetical protein